MRTILVVLAIAFTLSSCAGKTVRSKYSDPHMRVALWPMGVDTSNYVKIQQALLSTGKFILVDRGAGLAAIKEEQEALHKTQSDRFDDPEKFAHWGKLLGVGAVVVAHSQCINKDTWGNAQFARCQQFVEIVNSNTGEVMAGAEGVEDTSRNEQDLAPSWDDTIEKLVDAYPKFYEKSKDTRELNDYKMLSKEEALRMKEKNAQETAEANE